MCIYFSIQLFELSSKIYMMTRVVAILFEFFAFLCINIAILYLAYCVWEDCVDRYPKGCPVTAVRPTPALWVSIYGTSKTDQLTKKTFHRDMEIL